MIKFKNEIKDSEWIFGSSLIVIMIWVNYLFPIFFKSQMTVYKIPYSLYHYLIIYPQDIKSLPFGIITSQIYHLNNFHLSSNISMLIIFMIILAKISNRFIPIILSSMVLSGILTWAFHPISSENTNVMGASGLVFALLGYICLRIFINIDLYQEMTTKYCLSASKSITISFWVSFVSLSIVMIYWENLFELMNITKDTDNISYHGHFFGFITGVFVYFFELIYSSYKNRLIKN